MSVSALWYGKGLANFFKKKTDFTADTIKVQLHTSTYTPDQDAHEFQSDLSNEVANGSGYTTGGIALTTKTVTYTGASNTVSLDADDLLWSALSRTFRYAVVLNTSPGSAGTNPLLGYVDFGATIDPGGLDFRVTWDTLGLFKSVAA